MTSVTRRAVFENHDPKIFSPALPQISKEITSLIAQYTVGQTAPLQLNRQWNHIQSQAQKDYWDKTATKDPILKRYIEQVLQEPTQRGRFQRLDNLLNQHAAAIEETMRKTAPEVPDWTRSFPKPSSLSKLDPNRYAEQIQRLKDLSLVLFWVHFPKEGHHAVKKEALPEAPTAAEIRTYLAKNEKALANVKWIQIPDENCSVERHSFFLWAIPPEIRHFKNLTSLSCEHTNIHFIPEEIADLSNLRGLGLREASLKEIRALPSSLIFLRLSSGTRLPDPLPSLPHLKTRLTFD